MLYYNIKEDENKNLYFEKENEAKNTDYIIMDKSNKKLYPNSFMEVRIENDEDEFGYVGLTRVNLSDLAPITNQEAAININESYVPTVTKETKSKIIKPEDAHYLPFTKIVVNAILRFGKDVTLSQADHTRKVSLIASLNKLAEEEREISIFKAEEILQLFTLKLEDLFKEELK